MGYLKSRSAILCAGTFGMLLLSLNGCRRHRKTSSAPKSDKFADNLRTVVASGKIPGMHSPQLADYQGLVGTFYEDRNYEVAWVNPNRKGGEQPSQQARIFLQALEQSAQKGLNPQDYDGDLWEARLRTLAADKPDDVARFDTALTVSVMRYLSDLHMGRVNPTQFNFDIDNQGKKYNLPEFLSDNAVDSTNVPGLIHSVEPDNALYRATEDALVHYIGYAQQQAATPALSHPLPSISRPLAVGSMYSAADPLALRLALEGDLPLDQAPHLTSTTQGAKQRPLTPPGKLNARLRAVFAPSSRRSSTQTAPAPKPNFIYNAQLAAAVRHFQARHGLPADGRLNAATIVALNVPMAVRVRQLSDSLERWRWLPDPYVNAPLMVNLPEFVLRGYNSTAPNHQRDFTMKVVVGKVVGEHQTPVFTHLMRFLIFRPFWNVPDSIIKKELTEHIDKSGVGYLAQHNFETVDRKGNPVQATAEQVEHGGVVVREKPGPQNSLGLIKFMFPNQYDIYLHSTPTPDLFNRSRRDFSHGCIRVRDPAQLAVWVLRNTSGNWDLEKVQESMLAGPDNYAVGLKQPIPIVIFYLSANIGDSGQVQFFDDLYGYDKQLEQVLSKGRPYPTRTQRISPNNAQSSEDTP